ncbi:MAG: PIN domain-containing protein [Dehalococcoidia bacterium]|nr:PIN domain-containing protein [Dehalococcoidia bacterium]
MIHLDTGFRIRALVRGSREDRRLREWLTQGEPISISSVSWAEFLCGPFETEDFELASQFVEEPVPFLAADSALTARLFNMAGRRRGSLAGCMIAATAIRTGASLATADPRDFCRFEPAGLNVITV